MASSARVRVFVTGATSLLGSTLLRTAPPGFVLGGSVHRQQRLPRGDAVTYLPLDLGDPGMIRETLAAFAPDAVMHTAGVGGIDACERNRSAAWRINVEGTRVVAAVCRTLGATLVFPSSSMVFDGTTPLYHETSLPHPLCAYGIAKLQSERDLTALGVHGIIVRMTTLYGWHHPDERLNLATWALQKLREGTPLRVVTDVSANYLFVDDAARALWELLRGRHVGLFHLAGAEVVSRYEFTRTLAGIFGFSADAVTAATLDEFPALAPRPKQASFDIRHIRSVLSFLPRGVADGLTAMREAPLSPDRWQTLIPEKWSLRERRA